VGDDEGLAVGADSEAEGGGLRGDQAVVNPLGRFPSSKRSTTGIRMRVPVFGGSSEMHQRSAHSKSARDREEQTVRFS
jgi:hypothetical protein